MSGRGEPAEGWVESLAQMRMLMSTAPTQVWAAGGDRGRLTRSTWVRERQGRARLCGRGSCNKLHFARTPSEQHHRRAAEDAYKSAKLLRHRRV
jgi:hypothetical protein